MFDPLVYGIGGADMWHGFARLASGLFFAISGFHKLFNKDRHAALVATLQANKIPLVRFNQWFVPAVELAAGTAIVIGFVTPLAAFGLVVLLFVACITDGRKRVAAFNPINGADRVDDWLYLSEVTYIILLFALIALGSGPWSVDAFLMEAMK